MPPGCNEEALVKQAEYRQSGRIPVLSYIHKDSGHALWRSSEVKTRYMND